MEMNTDNLSQNQVDESVTLYTGSANNDEEVDPSSVSNVVSFFREKDLVLQEIICVANASDLGSSLASLQSFWDEKFEVLHKTLEKYQEQPTVLNSSLADLTEPLLRRMSEILLWASTSPDKSNLILNPSVLQFNVLAKIFHLICRIRGHKHVMKQIPHGVELLEPCFFYLSREELFGYSNWESKYVLLLWLRMVCLIPFDICSIDSSSEINTVSSSSAGTSKLIDEIVRYCSKCLADTGSSREIASLCLSSLLTRPDMESSTLSTFIRWAEERISVWVSLGTSAESEVSASSFEVIGILRCLGQIFKSGHRFKILEYCPSIQQLIASIDLRSNQVLVRKLSMKLIQRLGMTYLPARIFSWRYQRGQRSLMLNLQSNDAIEIGALSSVSPDKVIDEVSDIPEEMNTVFEYLLNGLSDKDTIVRWSAAKGIGRLAIRLDMLHAKDIVMAISELFSDDDCDAAWHGGCLALAELARRGILLPNQFPDLVPLVVKGMLFDIVRGYHSIGSHVRDAACYVCWAFARAYSPETLKIHMADLTTSMLVTSLFDREVNCRRAAAAALQENVGRQGNVNFPYGLEIIAIADYFSLGNLSHSYLQLAPSIASLSRDFLLALWDNLLECKLRHWDLNVRILAAKTMSLFSRIDPKIALNDIQVLLSSTISGDAFTRHGAVVAVGEVVTSLSVSGNIQEIPDELKLKIINIVPDLVRLRLFRGKASDQLRGASCYLIENISRSQLVIPTKSLWLLLDALDENFRQPFPAVQIAAQSALRQFLAVYFIDHGQGVEPSSKLIHLSVQKYLTGLLQEDNAAVTRGYSLALGTLPPRLSLVLPQLFLKVLDTLGDHCRSDKLIGGEADPETRQNSLKSVIELSERLCISNYGFQSNLFIKCWGILIRSCNDYTVDKRGDAGSWSRIVAENGLLRLVRLNFFFLQSASPNLQRLHYEENFKFSHPHHFVYCTTGICRLAKYNSNGPSVSFLKHSLAETLAEDRAVAYGNQLQYDECLSSEISKSLSVPITCNVSNFLPLWRSRKHFVRKNLILHRRDISTKAESISKSCYSQFFRHTFKLLSEKLDAVRMRAGEAFEIFMNSHSFYAPCIPDIHICISTLLLQRTNGEISFSWMKPGSVFPLISFLLESSFCFPALLNGLMVSIGGISESLSKDARLSVLSFASRKKLHAHSFCFNVAMLTTFKQALDFHSKVDRIFQPMINTLCFVLKNGLSDISNPMIYDVVVHFVKFSVIELQSCANIARIMSIISLMNECVNLFGPIRSKSFTTLLHMLGHKFPKIRKRVAETLYLQFVTDAAPIGLTIDECDLRWRTYVAQSSVQVLPTSLVCGFAENLDQLEAASTLLTSASWENLELSRSIRKDLFEVLGITSYMAEAVLVKERKDRKEVNDELDCYSALVRDAGY